MPEPGQPPAEAAEAGRFLTFRTADRLYALPAAEVVEVIRIPTVARLPQSPRGLLGVANLRGDVLPIASLRGLLGVEEAAADARRRAIVLAGAAPAAVAVDVVEALVTVAPQQLETRQAQLAADRGERLRGAFRIGPAQDVAKVLDLQALLAGAFQPRARSTRRDRAGVQTTSAAPSASGAAHPRLVTFEVAGQEFALELERVREIVPAPQAIAAMPQSEALVLGVAPYRETLLPLFSLRGLLGLPLEAGLDEKRKVLVVPIGGVMAGLLVDRMRAILPADPARIEPVPAVLAARVGGESRIQGIYRVEEDQRLVSILAPEQLLREDVMSRLGSDPGAAPEPVPGGRDSADDLQVLVFRLAQDEFALPISAVEEVAPAPEQITRVPKAPRFLEGVVNLRGQVLPVVDQRRRFDMPPLAGAAGRRLVVVRTKKHRAGLIVDSVSEVLRTSAGAVEQAPDLTGEAGRLVDGVINLEASGRIVLLLDPTELLTRTERSLLDKFQAGSDAS